MKYSLATSLCLVFATHAYADHGDHFAEDIWPIMNRQGNGGCRGCHIRPDELPGMPWFGNDMATVRQNLQDLGFLERGVAGSLAFVIVNNIMPRNGPPFWTDEQKALLLHWLEELNEEEDPEFDALWALLNRHPSERGCRTCHIRPGGLHEAPLWGNDRATVLDTLREEKLLAGGRNSRFAQRLATGEMPIWDDAIWPPEELNIMLEYVRQFDPDPLPDKPAMQLDRYQLRAAAFEFTEDIQLLGSAEPFFDRAYSFNPALPRYPGYSPVALHALSEVAKRICKNDYIGHLTGLPGGDPGNEQDIADGLERLSIYIIGVPPTDVRVANFLRPIYDLALFDDEQNPRDPPDAFGAVCAGLISHPMFTE